MAQAKGSFSGWEPRISARTPLGREISREAFEGYRIEFNLVQVSKDDETKHVDEPLSLEVKSVSDRYIKLEDIPMYLRKSLPKHVDSAVFDVRKITSNGTDVKTFSAAQQSGSEPSEADRSTTEPSIGTDYTGEPSRELLESITANVLDSLGYTTTTNDYRTTREGPKAEVDVWAENPQENFSIYVSCKNWNSEVGRPTVDEEVGRVINLRRSSVAVNTL
ncbi:restriction endonuclease [Salinarchaeum sp. IM2453]|uniref:restriction endonuclease n=1 Tax=Salinarchaeum sp. IM2453 TaxID=2862870 RepID=UPI001C840271|nr:restriction endonuclease [Salinarchaeum sp. IM2453]QZA89512.1 restriction endonuclease [Salinarchaeum sp. IM2453]